VIHAGSFEKVKTSTFILHYKVPYLEGSDLEFKLIARPNIRLEFWDPIPGQILVIPQAA
jgi:hypothetical protein